MNDQYKYNLISNEAQGIYQYYMHKCIFAEITYNN